MTTNAAQLTLKRTHIASKKNLPRVSISTLTTSTKTTIAKTCNSPLKQVQTPTDIVKEKRSRSTVDPDIRARLQKLNISSRKPISSKASQSSSTIKNKLKSYLKTHRQTHLHTQLDVNTVDVYDHHEMNTDDTDYIIVGDKSECFIPISRFDLTQYAHMCFTNTDLWDVLKQAVACSWTITHTHDEDINPTGATLKDDMLHEQIMHGVLDTVLCMFDRNAPWFLHNSLYYVQLVGAIAETSPETWMFVQVQACVHNEHMRTFTMLKKKIPTSNTDTYVCIKQNHEKWINRHVCSKNIPPSARLLALTLYECVYYSTLLAVFVRHLHVEKNLLVNIRQDLDFRYEFFHRLYETFSYKPTTQRIHCIVQDTVQLFDSNPYVQRVANSNQVCGNNDDNVNNNGETVPILLYAKFTVDVFLKRIGEQPIYNVGNPYATASQQQKQHALDQNNPLCFNDEF